MKLRWRPKKVVKITGDNIQRGDVVLAIRDCVMKSGSNKDKVVITKGKTYTVQAYIRASKEFLVLDDMKQTHYFHVEPGPNEEPFFVKYVGRGVS